MKTIIIYSSKTGYTKNYATWLSKELQCESCELKNIKSLDLNSYNRIIYGGGLYAGGINGLKKFKSTIDTNVHNNIIIYCTGASPSKSVDLDELFSHNFSDEESATYKLFYLRGGFDYNRINFIDKLLMIALKANLKASSKKRELTADEKGMLGAYEESVDFTKADKIKPVLDYVSSF